MNVALAIIRRGKRILIARRAVGRVYEGLWEFPGGKVHPLEDPEAAVVREAREETSLEVTVTRCIGVFPGASGVNLHVFECASSSGEPCASDPASVEVRWASLTEIRQLDMPPPNAAILDHLEALDREEPH
jgi:mutator protein MutT